MKVRDTLQQKIETINEDVATPNPAMEPKRTEDKAAIQAHLESGATWLDCDWHAFAKDFPDVCAKVKALL